MKLKELIKKLAGKPNQDAEVQFLVFEDKSNDLVCCDLKGPSTTAIMNAVAKGKGDRAQVT